MYEAEISRNTPAAFVFLVDQSASMEEQIAGGHKSKADAVADAINRLLSELSIKCAKEEGIRDYFRISVIGYGATVGPAFGGALSGRALVPISEVAASPARIEERSKKVDDGAGGVFEQPTKFPIWFDPKAEGGTPMTAALAEAKRTAEGWVAEYPGGFPPIVLNITDGESTDGDPSMVAEDIKMVASADGSALLFNLHVSAGGGQPLLYPDTDAALPDEYARLLFRMSSYLPNHMRSVLSREGDPVSDGTKGFVYNADVVSMVNFLDIGTRTGDLR